MKCAAVAQPRGMHSWSRRGKGHLSMIHVLLAIDEEADRLGLSARPFGLLVDGE